jgi:hypothetical protein
MTKRKPLIGAGCPLPGQFSKGAFITKRSTFPLYLIPYAVNVNIRVGEERAVILVPRLIVHMEDVALEYLALVVVVFSFCLPTSIIYF